MQRASFIKSMMSSYRNSIPDEAHAVMLDDLRDRVMRIGAQAANKAEITLFGSYVTRFCKPTSDADFSMTYRNFCPWIAGIEKVDMQNSKRLARFGKVATEEGMLQSKYIQAKIPVVQFVDNVSGIPCDVSIGNIGGVENSKILTLIRDLHPDIIGCYIHTVKEWGKAREFIAPDKQMFNSFTVTTMALMVLQELGIIPIFQRCSGECGEVIVKDAEAVLEGWNLPEVYVKLQKDDDIGEGVLFLLQKFAEYYTKFDFKSGTVSLIQPRRLRHVYQQNVTSYLQRYAEIKRAKWETHHKDHFNEVGHFSEGEFQDALLNEESQRPYASPFVVEDLVNYVNCGRRVSTSRMGNVTSELRRLNDILNGPSTVKDSLSYGEMMRVTNRIPRFSHFEGTGVKREMTFKRS